MLDCHHHGHNDIMHKPHGRTQLSLNYCAECSTMTLLCTAVLSADASLQGGRQPQSSIAQNNSKGRLIQTTPSAVLLLCSPSPHNNLCDTQLVISHSQLQHSTQSAELFNTCTRALQYAHLPATPAACLQPTHQGLGQKPSHQSDNRQYSSLLP